MGYCAFYDCGIAAIWTEGDSVEGVDKCADSSVAILKKHTMVGDISLWELRKLKDVIIPDGVQKIGEQWFMNSGIESVAISASVELIEKEAFCRCPRLQRVEFAEESRLNVIGTGVFA